VTQSAYSDPDGELHPAEKTLVPMPHVVNLGLPDARARLAPFRFVINVIEEETFDAETLSGTVIAQQPPADTLIAEGDPVDLTVVKVLPHPFPDTSTPPPPPDTPLDL
jgi:beta-lactam-binding protein with PASTA domain